jgi:hypothetical protein
MLLIDSSDFIREKQAGDALAAGNAGYVYVISRFDDDDSTLCFFGSMGYRVQGLPVGIGGVAPVTLISFKAQRRVQPTDNRAIFVAGREYVPINQVPIINAQQGGAHAEELFLRKLPKMFDEFGEPKKIDLFISRIPCAAASAPWLLAMAGGNVILPCGCSNKIRVVIENNPGITWRIWWRDPYPNANTQTECLQALSTLQGRAVVQRYDGHDG